MVRRLLGKKFLFVLRIQLAAFAKQAGGVNKIGGEMKQQQRTATVKDSTKKIRSKGRMDAQKTMVGLGVAGEIL